LKVLTEVENAFNLRIQLPNHFQVGVLTQSPLVVHNLESPHRISERILLYRPGYQLA